MTLLGRLKLISLWIIRIFFDRRNSSKSHTQFNNFLSFQEMDDVSINNLKLIELLQIDSIDKEAVSTEGNYKGRNEHWFQAKKGNTLSGDLDDANNDNSGDNVNIVRYTPMKFLCKSGKSETTKFYQILGFFNKYYNKCFPSSDYTFVSGEHGLGIKNPRLLERMMEKRRSLI